MKIVVTGARGYVGTALCNYLGVHGDEIMRVDIVDGAEQDIRLKPARDAIVAFKPDLIYNLAAMSGEAVCRRLPMSARATNFIAALNLRHAVPGATFVQASTASVLTLEDARTRPTDPMDEIPYAATKYQAEQSLLRDFDNGAPVYCFRFSTVFGWAEDRMRWDLPIHAMARNAQLKGVVTACNPGLLRPWISLTDLVWVLGNVRRDITRSVARGSRHPIPLCSYNLSIGQVARLVAELAEPQAEVVNSTGPDVRDYGQPVLVDPSEPMDSVIDQILRHA